jgi:beta-glucosidase
MFYPGKRNPWKMFRAAEMLLRAHAGAYHIIKDRYPNAEVGFAKHVLQLDPLPPKFVNRPPIKLVDNIFHRAYLEAVVTGELHFPLRKSVMIPDLAGAYDYGGLNFYQRYRGGFAPLRPHHFFLKQVPDPESPPSPPLWGEIYPQGLFNHIKYMWEMLHKPIYITETGTPDEGDEVRRWFIAQAVYSIWKVINFNIPVRGFYYWTLLDNFEWTAAYNPKFRFGLYATNFETQERMIRPSGEFYRAISLANGLSSAMVREYSPQLAEKFFPGAPGQAEVKLKPRS